MDLDKMYEESFKRYRDKALKEFEDEVGKLLKLGREKAKELRDKALKDIIAK